MRHKCVYSLVILSVLFLISDVHGGRITRESNTTTSRPMSTTKTTTPLPSDNGPMFANCPKRTRILNTSEKRFVDIRKELNLMVFDRSGIRYSVRYTREIIVAQPADYKRNQYMVIAISQPDKYGRFAQCSFKVHVYDNHAPVYITCPSNITAFEDELISWDKPIAIDNVGIANEMLTSKFKNNTVFPEGSHAISYVAIDHQNNSGICKFFVSIFKRATTTSTPTTKLPTTQLPKCYWNGTAYPHKSSINKTACETCTCIYRHTGTFDWECTEPDCPIPDCQTPRTIPGQCCPTCDVSATTTPTLTTKLPTTEQPKCYWNGKAYPHMSSMNKTACENCTCVYRYGGYLGWACTKHCPTPECQTPRMIPGQCCPTCDETTDSTGPLERKNEGDEFNKLFIVITIGGSVALIALVVAVIVTLCCIHRKRNAKQPSEARNAYDNANYATPRLPPQSYERSVTGTLPSKYMAKDGQAILYEELDVKIFRKKEVQNPVYGSSDGLDVEQIKLELAMKEDAYE